MVFDRHDQAVEPPSWSIISPPFIGIMWLTLLASDETLNEGLGMHCALTENPRRWHFSGNDKRVVAQRVLTKTDWAP